MKLLLDTHVLLWAAGQADRLPAAARTLLADPRNEPIFSAASLWEIAIKRGLGRNDFQVDARLMRRVWLSCWTNRHEYAKTDCQSVTEWQEV
jgi:PIN domain nuclease of toxin-antitoxin system